MTFHEMIVAILGDRGAVALAGAAGGLVRWLTLRSHPVDGIIAVAVGFICAAYLGPAATPLVDSIFSPPGVPPGVSPSSAEVSGFVIGIGGVTVSGFVLDFWRARRSMKKRDEEDTQ